ncbi:polymorphic toxin-type HINT domain-containing protein [Stratiformator vulcanicus]|uniref:Intein C-terminal splicing domain-containing protein n=1 Tax=Stratiformator vulcanicus TaxID=2527980 RepID=A0A517QWV4_9PLAN|nr:polymorphic toxin-type HINT domain-containing protein [Stratiformator vulcanicus]QDT36050.1 hypothetical protein Pan189_04050 [Stratiformator vulcanicus]
MDAITVAGVGLNVSALGRASKKCFTAGHMIVTAPPADMAANVEYAAMSTGPDEAGDSITIAAALAGALGLLVIKGRRNRREREREMKPQGWQLLATGWDTSATPVGDVGVDLNREFDLNGGLDQSEPQRFLSTPQKSIVRIEEPQRDAAPLERPRRSRNSLWRRVIGLTLLLGSAAVLAGSFFLGEATATAVSTAAATQATVEEFDTSHRKPIEEIKVGDKVLARDEDGEAIGWQEVDEIYERTSDHLRFLKVRSESGETQTFETTDEHPFWSASRAAWIDAGDLKAGEKLIDSKGHFHTLVLSNRINHPEGIAVFNFRVADAHTYYVGSKDSAGSFPLLVHNASYDSHSIDEALEMGLLSLKPKQRNRGMIHHIASDKDQIYKTQFQELFNEAGISLQHSYNRTRIRGHVGPHGKFYNSYVLERLQSATAGKSGDAFREALLDELYQLRREIHNEGLDALLKAAASKVDVRGY